MKLLADSCIDLIPPKELLFIYLEKTETLCLEICLKAGLIFFKRISISLLIASFIFLMSCNLRKKMVYLNENEPVSGIVSRVGGLIIQPGDRLEIKIAGLESQSGLPFYFSQGVGQAQGALGSGAESPANTFPVDSKGIVQVPVMGKVKLGGLTLEEAESQLILKLGDYIKSPVVSIRISNFMISVVGEVKNPGYFKVANNRLTLLEALAMAGDISPNGSRKEITVWRQEAGKATPYQTDITSNKIFLSPVFELRQNDLIYVNPNKSGLLQPTLFRTATPLAVSIASLIITTMLFFVR